MKTLHFRNSCFLSITNSIVGVIAVVYSYLNTNVLEVGDKCGFDGRIYCLMSKGDVVFEPYNRRTFLPYLAGFIKFNELYLNFYLLNILFLTISIILLILILNKLAIRHTMLILSIFMINPHTFRMLFSSPVLVDFLALNLVLLVIYLFLGDLGYGKNIVLIGALTILIFVRENISITFIFASLIVNIVLFFQKKISKKRLVFITFQFIYFSIITFIAFLQPKIEAPDYIPKTEILEVIKYWSLEIVASNDNFIRFVYLVIFGLGIFGITGIMNYKIIFRENAQLKTIYLFSTLLSLTSSVLGGDTARILLIPGIIFTLLFFNEARFINNLFFLICLNLALWVPWVYSTGTEESFLTVYGQRYLDTNVALNQFAQFLIVGLLLYVVQYFVSAVLKRSIPR